MIKAKDAIRVARSLIGTPYSVLDCINLIKKVIRDAPGGVKGYTTAGTNSLWKSYDMTAKYRDLTWRQTGLNGAQAGMIAFKADGEDYHHAGIVTENGTVVHSSSTQGGRGVVETPLTAKEGWTHLARHRYIATAAAAADGEAEMESYKAKVTLSDPASTLNVRNSPGTDGTKIGKLSNGAIVTVLAQDGDWLFVSYGDGASGYISGDYVARISEAELPDIIVSPEITIIDDAGNTFKPKGNWRVVIGGND